jgi:hypothetical protein
MKITIQTKYGILEGEISTSKNPKTAEGLIKILPIEGIANRWGDEIYFEIPLKVGEENSQQEVEIGTIAYWPPGNALCIFFGKTPVSTSEKPKAYSPVNVVGKITKNLEILKKVKDGDEIKITIA